MLSDRYQERRDRLIQILDLTNLECRFVEQQYRANTAARRVALLVGQYVETDSRSEREGLLRLLVETAVPLLRAAIEAAALNVPDGYTVLSDQHLRALRSVAIQGLVVSSTTGDVRDYAIGKMKQRLEVVTNLDGVVGGETLKEGAHG